MRTVPQRPRRPPRGVPHAHGGAGRLQRTPPDGGAGTWGVGTKAGGKGDGEGARGTGALARGHVWSPLWPRTDSQASCPRAPDQGPQVLTDRPQVAA